MRPAHRSSLLLLVLAGFAIILSLALIDSPPPARAATITVTTLADESNSNPAACSLREAIQAATNDAPVSGCPAGAGADTITFVVVGTIVLNPTLGPLSVPSGVLVIQGFGAGALALSGGDAVQLLRVAAGAQLTVAGLTLENGRAPLGGAIQNEGSVTVTAVDFRSNQAAGADPINVAGGVIFNTGSLSIDGSTFSGNRAERSGQGSADGGAIFNSGTLAITNSAFSGNRAGQDGGVISNTGDLTVTDSTFSDNAAPFAGAIMHWSGSLTVTASTFSGNSASLDSGAIKAFASLAVTNSTFSGNDSVRGGAIFAAGGTIALTNSTFGGNQSGTGVLLQEGSATFSLRNVVFANPAPSCAGNGQFTDQGGNITADATCPFTQPTSRTNTDPRLGPLQDNGGPTETMALQSGSPAIDAAVNCPPPATDQRGVPRTTPCDGGAYETQALTPTPTPSPTPSAVPTPASSPSPTPPPSPMTVTAEVRRVLLPIVSENQIEQTVVPVAGAAVEALVNDRVCGLGVTDGQGRVFLTVAPDPPTSGCGRNGAEVTFRVNGVAATGTVPFRSGGQEAVTLTLPATLLPR